jgi:hypothetical protein
MERATVSTQCIALRLWPKPFPLGPTIEVVAMLITAGPARRFQAALFESAHAHAVFALTRFSPLSNPRPSGSVVDEANGPRKAVDQVCTVAIRLLRPAPTSSSLTPTPIHSRPWRGTTREARTAAERLSAS